MTKTYKTINDINLSTSVKVGEKRVIIKFTGGATTPDGKVSRFGTFSTPSKELQEAIEADSSYGKSFACVMTTAKIVDMATPKEASTSGDDGNSGDGRAIVSGITNTNMAIEWLEANAEHKFTGRPTKGDVLEVAASLNINFVDWKQ